MPETAILPEFTLAATPLAGSTDYSACVAENGEIAPDDNDIALSDAAAAVSVEPKVGQHKDESSEKSCCFRPLLCSTSVTESAEIIAMSDAVNQQPVWAEENNRALLLSEFDERFRRYRLSVPEAERALVDSLKRYGQMAPVVVCICDGEFLLVDRAGSDRGRRPESGRSGGTAESSQELGLPATGSA